MKFAKVTRHLLPAVVVAAGIQASGFVAPAAATQPLSPDVAYHAPSWWITAVAKGNPSTLLTGSAQTDQRLQAWLVGFGRGFETRCNAGQVPNSLERDVAMRPAMEVPGKMGVEDGRRFAELNGCAGDTTTSVRQAMAGLRGTPVAEETPPPRQGQTADANGATRAIIINRSGVRIYAVQISEVNDRNWGEDRLGDRTLPENQSIELPLGASRSCSYDVRVVYVDGRVEERRRVNLCAQSQVTFDGSSAQQGRWAQNGQPGQVSNNQHGRQY